jgi:predicted AAA+ superfamily ATPase
MAITNHERVTRAMEWLRSGLAPYVEREIKGAVDAGNKLYALEKLIEDPNYAGKPITEWDAAFLLRAMAESWNEVFSQTLGKAERNLVFELRNHRNDWAHQKQFSSDDVYRVMDSVERLLKSVSAPESAKVENAKLELLRLRFDEQARSERRKSAGTAVESAASGSLKPWREIITPHEDVASGRYQQAEFAADLWQVHLAQGAQEYKDPIEFFRRTYLTNSLQQLLVNGIRRLNGAGGDPVVQLQTNFGGGKTHSMLALYHLFGGSHARDLPGVDALLTEAGVEEAPRAKRVVLVGNKISPGNPAVKADGTVVKTLWGELAYQLGGKKAYDLIRNDDKKATNPGDMLRKLFVEYGPCLILIDEWVAYARQLHDDANLPAGSFDTQFSFAQALTESAKLANNCLLVVSLPASDTATESPSAAEDVEVGGARGRQALDRLRNVIGRVESSWRPASAEEGFEIVRRRLFQPLSGNDAFKARDVVARSFADLYRNQPQEFPAETRDLSYEQRIKAAYPIHPEVFDRLYNDWSTLVKFQRTRGVLRLMAAVIHSLWEKGDRNPLIQPANVPIDDPRVQFELTRYLSDNWAPIIERDVDGPNSTPARIDGDIPNLGKYHATRRVARTIYMGSAPLKGGLNAGLEDRRIKLGCAMPDETPAVFGDALRRLAAAATYLYSEGQRFWYGTTPTVAKLAEDLTEQYRREPDKIYQELDARLRKNLVQKGSFNAVHPLPANTADVPDDVEARLVVLSPDHRHTRNTESKALEAARSLLERRGTSPRQYQNTLVFLAADNDRYDSLDEAIRTYLAWQTIVADKDDLDLTHSQAVQAETQRRNAESTLEGRIGETYQWLIVPTQPEPKGALDWQMIRQSAQEPLAVRASKKLVGDDLLVPKLGPNALRHEMDRVPLWRGDYVAIRQLIEDFAKYPYLPRLTTPTVLVEAVRDGLGMITWESDGFAYAECWDEGADRFRGLQIARGINISDTDRGVLVKPDAAKAQQDNEAGGADGRTEGGARPPTGPGGASPAPTDRGPSRPVYRRYHGTVNLDPGRLTSNVGNIAENVIAHLNGTVGARVRVTLEIQVEVPDGIPEDVVRIVTENGTTLGFDAQEFEEE